MQKTTSSEICTMCGECCKNYAYVELSRNDVAALETFTGLSPDVFANTKDEARGEYFMQFKENGDCVFLNEDDGRYSCSVYEARSGKCRNYPSTPSQIEVCNANRQMCPKKTSG
jgi:uncharacterized protein